MGHWEWDESLRMAVTGNRNGSLGPSVHTYSFFLGALLTSGGITIAKSRSHLTCILSFVGRGH